MKANEAPEKIYIHPDIGGREFLRPWLYRPANNESVEYARTDAFIEKAEEYLCKQLNEGNMECGDIETFIENFKKYMEDSKVWKKIRKFHEGDKLISTRNPSLTYEVLEVGHINELGNPEYKVRIFDNGKEAEPSRAYYMECKKVDEWANLIEPSPSDKPFDYENANIKQKDFAPS